MAQTLAEKIIARAAGREYVQPGEVHMAKVDLAMIHDSGGPRRVEPILRRLNAELFDAEKVVLVSDHYVPGDSKTAADILDLTRSWAAERRVTHYDGVGICHVVIAEHGHVRPGMFAVGGDSHSPTGGAFGAYMFGIGATEMAGVLATGEIWIQVPQTIVIDWAGELGDGLTAKDMVLAICGRIGMDGGDYQAIQYVGPAIEALDMQERMTLSNMAAELGAQAGLIAADKTTEDYLRNAGVDPGEGIGLAGDADATIATRHRFDAANLAPQIAAPHSPANADNVEAFAGTAIDVAYIGACTGAKFADLENAARILSGRRVAPGVQLLVAPASKRDQDRAADAGILAVFENIGARILPNACGICAGYGTDRLAEDVVCISSTARNFKGRMGAPSSQVYLGSPYSVAAAAVAGTIVDPRHLLQDPEK